MCSLCLDRYSPSQRIHYITEVGSPPLVHITVNSKVSMGLSVQFETPSCIHEVKEFITQLKLAHLLSCTSLCTAKSAWDCSVQFETPSCISGSSCITRRNRSWRHEMGGACGINGKEKKPEITRKHWRTWLKREDNTKVSLK